MARYIRYYENGAWKYASVKSVGDLEKLLTTSKTDIVSAINEMLANGSALEHNMNNRFDGLEGQQNELVTITGNVQTELGKVQGDLLNKVEQLYVDEQVKKLVNKADYDANYQKIESDLLDKVNIGKYNEEYQLITGRLNDKTDLSAFEGVKGRVATTEQEITNVKGELGSKIGKTEFDGAVGLNRWLARKYDVNIGSAGAIPAFSHIQGKQPSEVVDYDDNSIIKPFTGDYYVGHYFTNVYMKVAKTVTLTVTHDDGAVIYMNGAKMYEGKTRTTGLSVAMTFRAGWNTVEILHYEHSGTSEQVSLGLKLSTQVDKLTSVIGIGDKDDTRFTEAETQIKQNAEAILLKAEGSTVTSLGNKVTANEGSINVMKDEIKLLVKTDDFNKYTGRLETAESAIIQHSDQISQKVEKKDYNALNNIVSNQQTSINQLTDEIKLKATKSEYDGLNGRVGNAETQLNLNTEAIKLKAEKTELDKTNGRLSTAEAQLTVQAGEIASKVTQQDIDKSLSPIESRVGNAESTIVQHTTSIGLKANANEVYKKTEADGKISTAITQAKGEIKVETDKIALNVTNLTNTVTTQGTTITNHETSITQMKGDINLRAETKNVYTKTEADGKISTAVTNAKAEIKITTEGITQNVTNLQGDVGGLKDTVTAQGTQIKQTSDEVAINVVKKGNVKASINASSEGVKIGGQHVDITGQVTFSTLDPTMQGKVNAGIDAKNAMDNLYIGGTQMMNGTIFKDSVGWTRWGTIGDIGVYPSFGTAGQCLFVETKSASGVQSPVPNGTNIGLQGVERKFPVRAGKQYTLSMEVATSELGDSLDYMYLIYTTAGGNKRLGNIKTTDFPKVTPIAIGSTTYYYKVKLTFTADRDDDNAYILIGGSTKRELTGSNGYAWIRVSKLKLEEGNVATAWELSNADMSQMISDISVGGNNIISNSLFKVLGSWRNWGVATGTRTLTTNIDLAGFSSGFQFSTTTAGEFGYALDAINLTIGETYTLSAWFKLDKAGTVKVQEGNDTVKWTGTSGNTVGKWFRITHTFVAKGATTSIYVGQDSGSVATSGFVTGVQLERGNKATDWSLAQADVDKMISDVDTKAEASKSAISDMANDNKATPVEKTQLKKEWATIVAEKPQYEALATTYGITTEKTNYVNSYNALNTAVTPIIANTTVTSDINGVTFRATFDDYYDKLSQLMKKVNELSRSIGTGADTKAQEAKNSIADMANDNKITSLEKQQLKKEWASISAEKPQYEALATGYGVGTEKSNYVNAYNALNTFITPFLASLTTTSDINGATFRSTFDDYYDKKAQLIKKINELSKIVAQGFNGKVLYNDPMFKNGLNDVKVYNNSANSNVTVTRVAKPSDAPTNSTHVLEIKALALPISPSYGGFSFQTASRANAIFVTRIVAKIPVGSKLVFGSNSTGTGGKTEWLTPVTGTGNWEEYLCRVQCGSTGTFSSTNFFSIEGGTLPLTWYVAYATVIDATDYDYSITDMANDNKLTPLEKQQLKKEWATISAEKPQYEALSNTYGITTEKTNYVNSYNTLNTFLTPLIANITVTSDVVGSTFRATFDDYYDKKAQLIKKVNELARSIGTGADAKAQEAKNSIADMSSDSKITPVEKVQLAKEWATMVAEKPQYEALATTYGITTEKTNFVNTYNTLNTTLNGTGGILTSMTTTSTVVGATFRAQFDDYYDKMAQLTKKVNELAKSLADGAQGTANTANGKADTANTAINTNKATWDRASNINSNGTFNSSKLSGLILDAQISSAVNWNGAKSLLDSWKSGTTLINGGMIATNSIFAQQIAIGDFTNLSQINEEKNPNGYPTVLLNNKRYFKIGNGAYAPITIIANTYVEFSVNDEYYIAFNGYRDAGVTGLNAIFRYYYSDGTYENAGLISVLPTTADTRISKNLKITTAPNDSKTLTAVNLFFEKDGVAGSGYYYARDIEVRKRYTGELIVDGSIKAQQLDVASLFAHSGFITSLKAQDIDASKIKTGQLVGIYIRSDGTNAFSYMSGGSIVSKSKVASVETWVDEGLVRVKSSTSMLSLSEDNLSIGQIGKSGYGSLTYTAPNTDPSQNIFSMWGVGKVVIESNQSDIVLKGRAHIQGADSGGVSLNFPDANSIRFDGYGNITAPSTMINDATWSVRDGSGRTKLLIGVGKDSTTTSEYNAFGGGHAFNHNGERIFAIWKQGDANYVQQFAGQAIFKWQKNQGRFEIRTGDDTNWSKLAGIIENTSSREYKKNISAFDRSALDIINASKARLYHYNGQQDTERLNIGLIAEEAPELIQGSDGKTVDGYGMTTLAWKAIQELSEQVMHLNEKINNR
ncbi:hypothetical protein CN984_12330 [Bacillus cereus]|uniref:Uncharacterized protein n=1 Tax=Bacillus cereus TaxID=1396 RepID=A0A2A7FNN9_BACCE|nr:hypothetical protein CON44_17765 [Bacillus cereus]PGO29216.1 hypothetical protein CN984_12330 [Bacillus cereus]